MIDARPTLPSSAAGASLKVLASQWGLPGGWRITSTVATFLVSWSTAPGWPLETGAGDHYGSLSIVTPLLHLEYCLVLFWFPWDAFSLCSLCGCLLISMHTQRFGRDREMEVLRDMWLLELEIINRLLHNPGAFKETLERPFLILRD